MKHAWFSLLLALLLLPMSGMAESSMDLSGMNYEELIDLKAQIIKEMMTRDEFEGVDVPIGQYTIGEDIPAGVYTLCMADNALMGMIKINDYDESYVLSSENDTVGKIELEDGDTVEITIGAMTFKKYMGLGF